MRVKTIAKTVAAAILMVAAIPDLRADAATIQEAQIVRVMLHSGDTYGGCMAALSVDPNTLLATCASNWVTFSCTGDHTDTVRGYRLLDQAQLALAMNKRVLVTFSDTKTHNGYCMATRLDVY